LPTYSVDPRFTRDYAGLSPEEVRAFLRAKNRFVADLKAGLGIRRGSGVHQLAGHPGIYEFRWSLRGRATFELGPAVIAGQVHVIWRRIGGHEIYGDP
jgi:hypothetical protein